jgi:hypothetical protein
MDARSHAMNVAFWIEILVLVLKVLAAGTAG